MDFLLLGPLEVRRSGKPLPLGPRRAERCLLGLLLLEAGRIISVERLCDLLWDDNPPDNARNILQSHVSRLRSRLDPDRDGSNGIRLLAQGDGYRLEVELTKVDAFRFRSMTSQAEATADPAQRVRILREALALWRGPILADAVPDRLRDRIGTGLTELKLHAWEACMEAELAAGRHREVIAELTDLVAAYPLRERFVHLLMSALYRDGRQSCALDAYRAARSRIAELTGLDVSAELTSLHDAIIREEPWLLADRKRAAGQHSAKVPRQLPADIAHFVARERELANLIDTATGKNDFLTIAAIHGQGGTGKSALAIRAAHRLSGTFPDGALYLDLQGATPGLPPLDAHEGLERWLRALGLDSRRIPDSVAEAAASFRDLTADRRMLFVLDNARDAAQLKPLLPSHSGCFVIVTSRTILSTLDNATHMKIDTLTEGDALTLLSRFYKRVILPQERSAAAAIVRACGYLPLAVRVTGARLAARPDWTLSDAAQRLEHEHSRLDELQQEDLSVRASIAVSHRSLDTDPVGSRAAALLTRIGLLDCPDITAAVAAALADLDGDATDEALERLAQQQVLQAKGIARYSLHDLIRLYAREQAGERREAANQRAVERVLDHYVLTATNAVKLLFPGSARIQDHVSGQSVRIVLSDAYEAHSWIEADLANMVAVARQCQSLTGRHALKLVTALVAVLQFPLFDRLCRWTELRELSLLAISISHSIGDRSAQARARECLAMALTALQRFDEAALEAQEALRIYREVSDQLGQYGALFMLAKANKGSGRLTAAAQCYQEGIEVCRTAGIPRAEANLLDNLGTLYQLMRRFEDAISCHQHGLKIRQEQQTELGIAGSHGNLGWALLRSGRPDASIEHFRVCSKIASAISNFHMQAEALWGYGNASHSLGDVEQARQSWRQSVDVLRQIGAIDPEEAASIIGQEVPEMPSALVALQ